MNIKETFNHVICTLGLVMLVATPALAQKPPTKRVAVMLAPTQDAFVGTWSATFKAESAARGIDASIFSSPFDAALQARQIDDAVSQKFDGLVVQALSLNAIIPSLTRAKAAGIPVLAVISQMPESASPLIVSYVGEDSRRLGELAGEAMANALKAAGKPKGRIAAVTGSLADAIAPMRLDGFKASLKRLAPEATIVAVEDVRWNPVAAEQAAGQVLARFAASGGIDGLYGMNDRLANAAIQAAGAAGYKVGSKDKGIIVVGGNCQAVGMQNLAAGDMAATVEMLPKVSATLAARVFQEVLAGKAVNKNYLEQHRIITQANIAQVRSACSY
ncbi:MAG: sugar ABC transporter substrate-binding protein [Polaromonas sp.]|uniref:sugar ABC transporter substrate-binding protein n=1 Tax=Polaromonas sp. TaxID=1869339 RepID=UPI0025FB944C|nr:sugar ABC transporter substrate-binding protein [Polaromonas sp.]MBI2726549.1 sugar ABC transporter substrate-binding protein [Polaromonas sp.]